ncbi:hypothetical protein [Quisquiliibacterium transsilvanicum]|uniref:Uncharacterized protein n=1 Tax=Quisquiliibacterium transsilvanicum TaxID=1549638 RepID=A0A7W8M865_9BURK|nr:hypothetical protein [Quisquiliibacterium transsilvanicum]MBB5271317.1 hypothetical protein [Quisquiliibacterium transsilvanicum]
MDIDDADKHAVRAIIEKYGLTDAGRLAEFFAANDLRLPYRRERPGAKENPVLYRRWSGMMSRCYNPNVVSYRHYGGRGIRVCARWHDFENFVADMGEPPEGMSLDRIDVNGGYSPENCRWATQQVQVANRRPVKRGPSKGVLRTIAKMERWANEKFGRDLDGDLLPDRGAVSARSA